MAGEIEVIEAFESRARRREDRRAFFRAVGTAAKAAGGIGAAAISARVIAADPPSDADVLNFALNLEYLEAQFYSYAVTGSGIAAGLLTGTGNQGTVTIEKGKKVTFQDKVVAAYAREIAIDEVAHVNYLRNLLGTSRVAMPAIDISAAGAFSTAAKAAGLPTPFDPYAGDNNFLLAAYIFEDVGVTAYKGAASLLSNGFVEAAAGILATEAYHASIIRTTLTAKGVAMPSLQLLPSADAISNARETLDGTGNDDVGLTGTANETSIVPVDANGLVFGRDTGQVLNIAYLTRSAATMGGFFPKGVNGAITMSSAH